MTNPSENGDRSEISMRGHYITPVCWLSYYDRHLPNVQHFLLITIFTYLGPGNIYRIYKKVSLTTSLLGTFLGTFQVWYKYLTTDVLWLDKYHWTRSLLRKFYLDEFQIINLAEVKYVTSLIARNFIPLRSALPPYWRRWNVSGGKGLQ